MAVSMLSKACFPQWRQEFPGRHDKFFERKSKSNDHDLLTKLTSRSSEYQIVLRCPDFHLLWFKWCWIH